jgi:hypothetical protein
MINTENTLEHQYYKAKGNVISFSEEDFRRVHFNFMVVVFSRVLAVQIAQIAETMP